MNDGLIIVDGHAVLHRAFHALPPLTSSGGQPTGAVYGFFKMILRLWADFAPKYFLVALDAPGPNFRHEKFIGYQAKRAKTDEKLVSQINLTREILIQSRIAASQKAGYEADDLIGTVTKKVKNKFPVLIVTGDKDLTQLVGNKVSLFLPKNGFSLGRIMGPRQVKEDLGIKPSQVVDYKGLVGDSSDNYPGALGIGPKTGASLLNQFDNLATIYASLDQVKPLSVREKLVQYRNDVFLSAELAKINCQVPFDFNLDSLQANRVDFSKLKSTFSLLGFRSLLADLNKAPSGQMDLFKNK